MGPKAFADRHNCEKENDKQTPATGHVDYRYAKSLGLSVAVELGGNTSLYRRGSLNKKRIRTSSAEVWPMI